MFKKQKTSIIPDIKYFKKKIGEDGPLSYLYLSDQKDPYSLMTLY